MNNMPLNVNFVKDYINFFKGDVFKINGLLNYAFYLLIKKTDELSLNFAYSIIINYTLKFRDYNPLIEFSIIFGYSPILNIIYNKIGFTTSKEIENFVANYYIEDNRYNDKILTSGQKVIYKMLDYQNDYSVVAPTSFGKTDLMLESALNSNGDCIIIVPLIALLNQIKIDLSFLTKKRNQKIKLITHHEIKRSNNYKNIYILTQERCFELIKRNKLENITDLFVDESHKLLNSGGRSYKLSQIIFLLKRKFNCYIRYYSPVLYRADSIKIKGVHNDQLKTINGIRDMKCYQYYFYHNYHMEMYVPNTVRMTDDYVLSGYYLNFDEYILKNCKNKNIIFLNSPKDVEKKAIDFSKNINYEINIECNDLIDFIGKDYYILDIIKKGVIYIHGEMPDIIKSYLLNLYRINKDIKFLFTNSSILEGVNTPSDSLFIYDYNIGRNVMKPQDFINLRGRINRINEIVKSADLSKLICETHFNCQSNYKKQKIRNEVIDPCYGIIHKDEINNEYLMDYSNKEKSSEFLSSLEQIKLIDENADIKSIFEEDIVISKSDIINKCLLNNIILNENQETLLEDRVSKYHGRNINTIDELLTAINDIFKLDESDEISISRLSNVAARNFYSFLIQWIIEGKTIKEKASRMTKYYSEKPIDELIYVGKRGDIAAELIESKLTISISGFSNSKKDKKGNQIRLKKLWTVNNQDLKKLYNICVIKVKVEEDFISFKLIPYIDALEEINDTIINKNLYNLIKYKSNDLFEIELIKEGFSIYLARALNNEVYKKYISFSDLGVTINSEILNCFTDNKIINEELIRYLL